MFDIIYATKISKLHAATASILLTNVKSNKFQTQSKQDTTRKIDVNSLSVCSLQNLMLLFLDKHHDFANKSEEFHNPSIK